MLNRVAGEKLALAATAVPMRYPAYRPLHRHISNQRYHSINVALLIGFKGGLEESNAAYPPILGSHNKDPYSSSWAFCGLPLLDNKHSPLLLHVPP